MSRQQANLVAVTPTPEGLASASPSSTLQSSTLAEELVSIILGLILLEEKANLAGESTIILAVIATVFFSVFAHGISAVPAIRRYAQVVKCLDPESPECQEPPGITVV